MAVSKTELDAAINALTPLVTLDALKDVLLLMSDNFSSNLNLIDYDSDSPLTEGENTVQHNLDVEIYEVWIIDVDEKIKYKPNFVTVDENEITVIWVGDFPSNYAIKFLTLAN
jgi:ABC-type Na+ efflux pump permease subunit